MNNIAICTVSSANYYSLGKTLLQSVAARHNECDLFYLIVDKDTKHIQTENWFTVLPLDELNIPNIEQMAFVYDNYRAQYRCDSHFLFSFLLNKGYKKLIFF